MTGRETRRPLGEWLREAYRETRYPEAECPTVESLAEAAQGLLPTTEAQDLERHAGSCPRCAAELDLARAFRSGEDASADPGDVEYVVSGLQRSGPGPSSGSAERGRVIGFPDRRRRVRSWSWNLAAAAVAAIAIGAVAYTWMPPRIGPRQQEVGAMRGALVELVAPVGDVAESPLALEWEAVEGAEAYRVELLDVEEAVLWRETVPAPPAELPAEVRVALFPRVRYYWRVEALAGSGETVSRSDPHRGAFRILPPEPSGERGAAQDPSPRRAIPEGEIP